jgi:hypothetical protein
MVKLSGGGLAVLWGAAVLAYAAHGDPELRTGLDGAGFMIALLLAAGLVLAGTRALLNRLRDR